MHFSRAWSDLLTADVDTLDLQRGAQWSLLYAAIFGFLAYRHFLRKDVLS